jgi:prephenate dehydratase
MSTDRPRVAFQGERGAFSEEAAVKLLGKEIMLVPRPTFAALFKSLDEGVADFILAPVENSIAGAVDECQASIQIGSLSICGEVSLLIMQNLIGCEGASFEKIATVESHPVALAQCRRFFAEHPLIKAIAADDTAGSVAAVITRGDPTRAAIAGRRAAEIYGGTILREHLEDEPENYTRFVLLQADKQSRRASATRVSEWVRRSSVPG